MPKPQGPTPAQLKYLRALASEGSFTFAEPRTRKQATYQIRRLRQQRRNNLGILEASDGGPPALAATSWRPEWVERRAAERADL